MNTKNSYSKCIAIKALEAMERSWMLIKVAAVYVGSTETKKMLGYFWMKRETFSLST